ncbi:MAG TPA: DUF4097 family beta strand repeat-containing protein, partial [Bryobacteraceae bacterium]|nr:DUF4097 family beta strand repeat-containing protein [Bryobacteraceae bacterium]
FLGRYWPFLFIAWGVIRLLEIVVWAVRGRPLPTSGISGGEWVMVVFLSIIGSTLYAFQSNGWGPARFRVHGIEVFGESYDYTIDEKKVPVGKVARVVVENLRGNTRITGSDTAEVRVTGRKIVRALSREDADRANSQAGLEVLEQGDSIVIRTNQERAPQERHLSAELEISVPNGVIVQARGRHGDFDVNDVKGGVEIDSDNAGVRMQNIGGNVRVNVRRSDVVRAIGVTGDVDLQGRGNDVELENVAGQVTIEGSWGGELQFRRLAKPLRFQGRQADVAVQKVNGELRVGRGFVHGETVDGPVVVRGHGNGCCDVRMTEFNSSLLVQVERGDLDLRPAAPMPKIDVDLRNGDVDLYLPRGAKFNLKARTSRGELENDYGDPLQVHNEGQHGGTLTGNVGDGPSVTISTDRGRVSVRKSDEEPPAAPLAPQAPTPPPRRDRSE